MRELRWRQRWSIRLGDFIGVTVPWYAWQAGTYLMPRREARSWQRAEAAANESLRRQLAERRGAQPPS